MKRVESGETWSLFDPHEVYSVYGVKIQELWGKKFEDFYTKLENDCVLELVKNLDAKDLLKQILKTQVSTGLPYISFKDTINSYNPNKDSGYIPNGNLCVTGDTKILTSEGHLRIDSLIGKEVEVWNGEEWSKVTPFKTNDSAKILKVNLSNGTQIKCTEYHKFLIAVKVPNERDPITKEVEAKDLKPGDKLINFDLPLIKGSKSNDPSSVDLSVIPSGLESIEYRLSWISKLIEVSGDVINNNTCVKIYGDKSNDYLLNVRLILQTLGIQSKVIFNRILDGSPKSYYIIISSENTNRLLNLGLRVDFKIQYDITFSDKYTHVDDVINTFEKEPTYCFTEPKRNRGVFNGNLLAQCQESFSNVSSTESHVCNLASINLTLVDYKNLELVTRSAVRFLDDIVCLGNLPTVNHDRHQNYYRTIGVGTLGLADWLAKNNLNYINGKSEINRVYEHIAYYCFLENIKLGKERGNFEAFESSELKKGIILGKKFTGSSYTKVNDTSAIPEVFHSNLNWDYIVENSMEYARCSQLLAIAPNTSTGLLVGSTSSFLPAYKRHFVDKNEKGAVPIMPAYIKDKFWYYTENVTLDQNIIIDLVGNAIQPWIDAGISMELVLNFNIIGAKDYFNMILNAWKKQCKTIYYLRPIAKDLEVEVLNKNQCISCAN